MIKLARAHASGRNRHVLIQVQICPRRRFFLSDVRRSQPQSRRLLLVEGQKRDETRYLEQKNHRYLQPHNTERVLMLSGLRKEGKLCILPKATRTSHPPLGDTRIKG